MTFSPAAAWKMASFSFVLAAKSPKPPRCCKHKKADALPAEENQKGRGTSGAAAFLIRLRR
jgi:hypothetical protein